jgi:putative toxin-antitoxin system antitoxin component (TIGR02293 family)
VFAFCAICAYVVGKWQNQRNSIMSAAYALARPVVMPSELDVLAKHGFSNDEIYKIVAPRRTLARRKEKNERLSVVETDRVLRLKRIVKEAERVFSEPEKAHRWLRKPSRALGGAVPLELLETEEGARIVENEIGVIDHGMFA